MNDIVKNDSMFSPEGQNLAETLARVLPKSEIVHVGALAELGMHYVAVPAGFTLKQLDEEPLLEHPRRTKAIATLSEAESFCAYVNKHAQERTVVWCDFNPQTFKLDFTAVIDEHAPTQAGWRAHQARYTPAMSAEWKVWKENNKEVMSQLGFAEYLERHEPDITAVEGYPSSLQMLQMATEFEATHEKRLKTVVRLQGGGQRLDFVDDEDKGTLASMKLFEKFAIGIPVFWAGAGYRIDARLKYRTRDGKVSFWFELIRADRVHEDAAKELIEQVRKGIGAVPLLMGECK